MEEESKVTMYCSTCDAKCSVLEGEVTCPDCGALLEAPPADLEGKGDDGSVVKDVDEEDLLGLEVEDDHDGLDDEGDIK